MTYEITIRKSAQKSLAKIPHKLQENIITSIRALSDNPWKKGCKKLSGREAWRIRVNSYRVIYEIHRNELQVIVIDIAHRKEVYR